MGAIHMFMHSKGGVGKTTLCSMAAQYCKDNFKNVVVLDCDYNNQTLAAYQGLGAHYLELTTAGENAVNLRTFDALMERVFALGNGQMLLDIGSNSYGPWLDYMMQANIPKIFHESGHKLYLHSIITGTDFERSVQTLGHLMERIMRQGNCKTVVWLNGYNGEVKDQANNKTFDQTKIYKDGLDYIQDVAYFPELQKDTSLRDFQDVLVARKKTFAEVVDDPSIPAMVRFRIKGIRESIYKELERINVFVDEPMELVGDGVESGKKSKK